MSNKDVYEELMELLESEGVTGVPMRPEGYRIVRLLYTPAEARLALQVGLSGGTLDQLAEKTGTEKTKLKEMLHAMANKSTIFYDPGKEDPTYRVVGGATAPGWCDAALWGGIRFPYSVEQGKALRVILDDWLPLKMKKAKEMGFSWAPVWAAIKALPKGALPSENIAEVVKEKGSWSVSPCPCRLSHWLATPGDHCSHMLEVCMLTGQISRWAVKHGMARELTYDQYVELARKCEEDGLVHTGDPRDYDILCNCCEDCCMVFVGGTKFGEELHAPSPFMAYVDEEKCDACGTCAEACPVGAIQVEESASTNTEMCLGCGVCVLTCSPDALTLVRRPAAEKTQVSA